MDSLSSHPSWALSPGFPAPPLLLFHPQDSSRLPSHQVRFVQHIHHGLVEAWQVWVVKLPWVHLETTALLPTARRLVEPVALVGPGAVYLIVVLLSWVDQDGYDEAIDAIVLNKALDR